MQCRKKKKIENCKLKVNWRYTAYYEQSKQYYSFLNVAWIKYVIEGNRRWEGRCLQVLYDLKEKRSTGILKGNYQIAMCGELALEETLDLLKDRLQIEWMNERMNEWMEGRTNEPKKERARNGKKERKKDRKKERKKERKKRINK